MTACQATAFFGVDCFHDGAAMSGEITSPQNRRVKDAAKLRGRRQRTKQARIIIDGTREIRQAFNANVDIEELFCCRPMIGFEQNELISEMESAGVEVLFVAPSVFEKLEFGERNDGIVAVAKTPTPTLDELSIDKEALVVVVEAIEKPGNVGAVLRSADGAGVKN